MILPENWAKRATHMTHTHALHRQWLPDMAPGSDKPPGQEADTPGIINPFKEKAGNKYHGLDMLADAAATHAGRQLQHSDSPRLTTPKQAGHQYTRRSASEYTQIDSKTCRSLVTPTGHPQAMHVTPP